MNISPVYHREQFQHKTSPPFQERHTQFILRTSLLMSTSLLP